MSRNLYSDILTARSGDKAAKDKIIEDNMGLVYSAARRFCGRGCDFEDLCQLGCIGLIKAADRFDPSAGNRFSTYAVPLIIGEIKRFLRDDGIVKVSRSLKELSLKVYRLRQNPKFAEASVSELAGALGCGAEEVAYAIKSASAVSSLDELSENGAAISEKNDSFDDADNRIIIKNLLAELSDEDRKIVILRYFRQKTQSETAKLIGVSQVQISRREKKILQNLRDLSYK